MLPKGFKVKWLFSSTPQVGMCLVVPVAAACDFFDFS